MARLRWCLLILCVSLLWACVPASALDVPSPTASLTPEPSPTITVVWFPPTATFTPFPTPEVPPTATPGIELGEVLVEDGLADPELWQLGPAPGGNASLAQGELSLTLTEPGGFLLSARQGPPLTDFYVEVTASTSLCAGEDEYGLALRVSPEGDYYRYSLACDGRVRLDRIYRGGAAALQAWIPGAGVPPGAPASVRLAAWIKGEELHLYIGDELQFTVRDPLIPVGTVGLFARSAGQNAVTVSFQDLVLRALPD